MDKLPSISKISLSLGNRPDRRDELDVSWFQEQELCRMEIGLSVWRRQGFGMISPQISNPLPLCIPSEEPSKLTYATRHFLIDMCKIIHYLILYCIITYCTAPENNIVEFGRYINYLFIIIIIIMN